MTIQTWLTTLTIESEPRDIARIRESLAQHAPPVPSRNADVLSKFILTVLKNNAEYEGAFCTFKIKRPILPGEPWRADQGKYDEWPGLSEPRSRLGKLAIGSFGLLVMLAAILTIGAGMSRHGAHAPPFCYALHRVADIASNVQSSACPVSDGL